MLLRFFSELVVLAALFCGSVSSVTPAHAQQKGEVPGQSLGISSDSDLWRFVRTGNAGSTQMKDELAAVMIQSEGEWVDICSFSKFVYHRLICKNIPICS